MTTDAQRARELLTDDSAMREGLRVAYDEYVARAGWVPFERFELAVQILAESDE